MRFLTNIQQWRYFSLKSLVLVLFLSSIISCISNIKKSPLPVNGILDLREWDFEKNGQIEVNGYWDFYFGKYLTSAQFDTLGQHFYAWVPGVWKRQYFARDNQNPLIENRSSFFPQMPWQRYFWKGEKLGGTGFASYRLKVLLPPDQKKMAIKVNSVGTAYRFFINDSLIASAGEIGTSKESSVPQYLDPVVIVENLNDTASLTFWISNYHYRRLIISYWSKWS